MATGRLEDAIYRVKDDALKQLAEIDKELARLEQKLMDDVRNIKSTREYAERVANKIQGGGNGPDFD